jgi:hypothetical protein
MKFLWNFGVNKYISSSFLALTKIAGLMNKFHHCITELLWSIPIISTQHVSTSAFRLHIIQINIVLRNLMGTIIFCVHVVCYASCTGLLTFMAGIVQRCCSGYDTVPPAAHQCECNSSTTSM